MSGELALIIDDEPDILELLGITLERMNISYKTAENLETAKHHILKNDFNICITDMRLPDGDGVEFISYIQENFPNIPVIIITAHGSIETAIQALKLGAFDFLTKPVDLSQLRHVIGNAIRIDISKENENYRLIGESDVIRDINKMISKLSRSQAPVYISGESGVGKELVARKIHELGPRFSSPFVPVNCGAIPPDLMESEFFGHVKGSFTGAIEDKRGLFEVADTGTLFLDEIAELPQNMQVKLLRAIQEGTIRKIGSVNEQRINVRILSATHKNLHELVNAGQFRQDLFYRINVIELHISPLRERKQDIPSLVEFIINKFPVTSGNTPVDMDLSDDAMRALLDYSFPGNVRELENILQRAIALSEGQTIMRDELQLPDRSIDETGNMPTDNQALDSFLEEQEREKILAVLEQTRWNKTAAAKKLGISFRALRYRLEKLGID